MREGDDLVAHGGEVRLSRLPRTRPAARGIARMSDGDLAGKRGEVALFEHLGHEAKVFVDHDGRSVADGDAGRLLAAVLQRLQAKVRQSADVAVLVVNAEDGTLVVEMVVFEPVYITFFSDVGLKCRIHLRFSPRCRVPSSMRRRADAIRVSALPRRSR